MLPTEEVENACFTLIFDKCLSLPSVERRSSLREKRGFRGYTKNAIKEEREEKIFQFEQRRRIKSQ